jgi:hypothetical protein
METSANFTNFNVECSIENVKMSNSFTTIDCSQNNFITTILKPKPKRTFHKKSPLDAGLVISYDNYVNKKLNLMAFKLAELKDAAKSYKLHITGTKPVLIERLETYYKKINSAITIQRTFRGRLVRLCIGSRGPALKNRSLCVNDTDFVTMDPLCEIPLFHFFSYKDDKEFVYGFHISSLMHLVKSSGYGITNPYNREKIPPNIVTDIIRVYNTSIMLFEDFRNENATKVTIRNGSAQNYPAPQRVVGNNYMPPQRSPRQNPVNNNAIRAVELDYDQYQPAINVTSIQDDDSVARLNRIREMRNRPIDQRIRELFAEIDQLGNYTQSAWFTNLTHNEYGRLYRVLYEIWNYRGQMPRTVRNRICPFHGPFESIFNRPIYPSELNYRQLQIACLIVFENMVYSGIDEDHRKLGTFHALSGLTMVSIPARTAMPWLYESIV